MKLFKTLILICLIGYQSVNAEDTETNYASTKENIGFGLGSLIGGLIAGPVGAVVGAGGGGWLGDRENKTDETIASLEKELNEKSIQLAYQQNELAETKSKFQQEFQKVMLKKEIHSLEKLSDGISYTIYYKTNDAKINQDILPEIHNLAKLLKEYPKIQIQISGYTDYRGSDNYNLKLSKERIENVRNEFLKVGITNNRFQIQAHGEREASAYEGDSESYVFDRRVTINLTLNQET